MRIRDRIKELRRVVASELVPNPKNWRSHPPAQQDALKGLLAELGYCDAVLAASFPTAAFNSSTATSAARLLRTWKALS